MSEEEFKAAHKRLQEISSRVKQITGSLTADQQKKYDKKQERKLNKVTTNNRERL
jgi:tetrahydromethanopterin S-methyltransferase subunit G